MRLTDAEFASVAVAVETATPLPRDLGERVLEALSRQKARASTRIGRRDELLRQAAALLPDTSLSARAVVLERELVSSEPGVTPVRVLVIEAIAAAGPFGRTVLTARQIRRILRG